MGTVVNFRGPSNVVPIKSHVLGSGGAMRKLTERELDSQIAANRERQDDAFDRMEQQLAHRRALSRPSVIPLDNSLFARAVRALRWALQLKGPQP